MSFYRSVVIDSFNIELVSNASFNCYPNNSLSSFTIFLPEQIHLKGEWEVAISEISYPSLYQNVTEGKFTFVEGRESPEEKRKIQPMHPGLYPSIIDIVVAMNDKVRKNTSEKLWVDRGTEYGETIKKFCKEKDIEVYSTMSETKAKFAERAFQFLKHIIYRYIEDHGENFSPSCSILFLH